MALTCVGSSPKLSDILHDNASLLLTFLCLSRACLGKMMILLEYENGAKDMRFRTGRNGSR